MNPQWAARLLVVGEVIPAVGTDYGCRSHLTLAFGTVRHDFTSLFRQLSAAYYRA